jgi:hypothetical protein
MSYEAFLIEYRKAFAQAMKYGPNTVGGYEASARMAELADAFPEFAERAENE